MSWQYTARAKLIKHNVEHVDNPDDESLPYRVELKLQLPAFSKNLPIVKFGCEHVVLRFSHREAVEHLINDRPWGHDTFGFEVNVRNNPRLKELRVTGPEGEIIHIDNRTGN